MSIYQRTHPTENRNSTIYTPPEVAVKLHEILTYGNMMNYDTVLDPCIGTGNLVWPFRKTSHIIGSDIAQRPRICDTFRRGDFTSFKRWLVQPDLIVINPPFNGGDRRMMWPERFLRQTIKLFGPSVPTLIIVPVGFRFNMRYKSRRRHFLKNECPQISSIVSLPLDVFKDVQVFSEVLIFNMPMLDAHYII